VSLPPELRNSLPSSIDVQAVRAAARASGSPGSLGGETWLLDLDGQLAVLVRGSIFDPLEPLALASVGQPVELREGGELEVRPAAGPPFVVRPSLFEIERLAALLDQVEGVASLASPPSTTEVPDFGEPRREPDTLTDLDVIDPELEVEAVTALEAGEYQRVVTAASELARQSSPRDREEWSNLVEIVAHLRAGDCVAAYLWTHGVRQVPVTVTNALFGALANALERRDEAALAWAAAGQLLVDQSGSTRRSQIEARLDRDGPTLAREVASRARSFFSGPAEAGDRLAQRGLAHALMELDEIDTALTWIRRATKAERYDFDARMLETQILALRSIETNDDRELLASLQKVGDDFPDRPEPLVALADRVEFDDPDWAITSLRKAQDREFNQFVLITLVELLEQNGRHHEVIREIEHAFADGDSVAIVAAQLREKLAAVQAKLGVGALAPTTPSSPEPAARASVVAIAIGVVLIAAALALALAL
jgi:hypothetical protein